MSCISVISYNSDGKHPPHPSNCESSRADTVEIKSLLFNRLGRQRAQRYIVDLTRLLTLKLTKQEFDKLCRSTIGKENIYLHNLLIKSIIGNACKVLGSDSNSRQTATGNSRTGKLGSVFTNAPKGITENRIQLGPSKKVLNGGVGSVEDSQEVEQVRACTSPCVQSQSPVRAPLGVPKHIPNGRGHFSVLRHFGSELPDTSSLHRELGKRLATHQISLSRDSANLLNISLDVFLKKLVRAGTGLARARQNKFDLVNGKRYLASMQDFRVAFESKPELLGANWPLWLEKMSDYTPE